MVDAVQDHAQIFGAWSPHPKISFLADMFATPTTLLVVPYLFAMLRKGNDGKTHHGVFDEVLE